LAIALATMPMFSPNWGSTKMITGPPVISSRVLFVPAVIGFSDANFREPQAIKRFFTLPQNKKSCYRHLMTQTSIQNICQFGNRAFIFGGAYGNFQATQAILEKASALGFAASQMIFTGDMVAYCANPQETVNLIRNNVQHIIMGNCEEAIAQGAQDCGCGFEEGSECSLLSRQWYEFCKSEIDMDTAGWMGSLPRSLNVDIGGHVFMVTHSTPASINDFIFPSNLHTVKDDANVDGYITGHSGIPFIGPLNDKLWINSGAAGMPANDGTTRIWYATIEASDNHLILDTNYLDYDHDLAAQKMIEANLNNGYAECLKTGIWPSHDILPATERAQTGTSLKPIKKALKRAPLKVVA
jgi:predicted phosphodiesterase